jgi:hypothetical protein
MLGIVVELDAGIQHPDELDQLTDEPGVLRSLTFVHDNHGFLI